MSGFMNFYLILQVYCRMKVIQWVTNRVNLCKEAEPVFNYYYFLGLQISLCLPLSSLACDRVDILV